MIPKVQMMVIRGLSSMVRNNPRSMTNPMPPTMTGAMIKDYPKITGKLDKIPGHHRTQHVKDPVGHIDDVQEAEDHV